MLRQARSTVPRRQPLSPNPTHLLAACFYLAEAVETRLAVVAHADAPGATLQVERLHRLPLGPHERARLRRGAAAYAAGRRRVQQHRVDETQLELGEARLQRDGRGVVAAMCGLRADGRVTAAGHFGKDKKVAPRCAALGNRLRQPGLWLAEWWVRPGFLFGLEGS